MGTLHDQTPRDYRMVTLNDLDHFMELLMAFKRRQNLTYRECIELIKVAEYKRRTDFMIDDRDRWDEQISGIGTALETRK